MSSVPRQIASRIACRKGSGVAFTISACVNLLLMVGLALVALPLLGNRSGVRELTLVPWIEETGEEVATLAVERHPDRFDG